MNIDQFDVMHRIGIMLEETESKLSFLSLKNKQNIMKTNNPQNQYIMKFLVPAMTSKLRSQTAAAQVWFSDPCKHFYQQNSC
jgi:hypothetical protein